MKIVTLSDLHGHLPENLPEGDCLVIAGDICPATNHNVAFQAKWLEVRFNLWLDFLPYKDIVCIAGNHDWVFEKAPAFVPKLKCHYLQESSVVINGVKMFGYPHTPVFCNWAFNRSHGELTEIVNKIPEDTDVILSHGPAYGILDSVTDQRWHGTAVDLGCKALRKRVDELPNLKLVVCGHIHSAHDMIKRGNTTFVNASYLNESYYPDYSVQVVEI